MVLLFQYGSILVLKAAETTWISCVLVDFRDKKGEKGLTYEGKEGYMRREWMKYVELSLLFQKADKGYTGRTSDSVFGFHLHRDVFWRMGPDSAGFGILFGTKGGNAAESL